MALLSFVGFILAGQSPASTVVPTPAELVPSQMLMTGRPSKGKPKVVVFTDFECGACRAEHQKLMKVGGIPVYLRNFPLVRQHPNAMSAALLAAAAGEKGVLPSVASKLFSGPLNKSTIGRLGKEFDLNATKKQLSQSVKADLALGTRLGIQQVPTYFLIEPNGKVSRFVHLKELQSHL